MTGRSGRPPRNRLHSSLCFAYFYLHLLIEPWLASVCRLPHDQSNSGLQRPDKSHAHAFLCITTSCQNRRTSFHAQNKCYQGWDWPSNPPKYYVTLGWHGSANPAWSSGLDVDRHAHATAKRLFAPRSLYGLRGPPERRFSGPSSGSRSGLRPELPLSATAANRKA